MIFIYLATTFLCAVCLYSHERIIQLQIELDAIEKELRRVLRNDH